MCLKLKIKTPDLLGPSLIMYKRRNNILLQLLTDVKSLRQRIVHKTRFWYKGVLLKKSMSSLQVSMFNRREQFFFQSTVFLYFTKLIDAIHFFNGFGMDTVFLKEHLQPGVTHIQCIWQIFLFKSYCYFKGALAAIHLSGTIIISGNHLQWFRILQDTVFLWNKHLQSSLFSKVLS